MDPDVSDDRHIRCGKKNLMDFAKGFIVWYINGFKAKRKAKVENPRET